MSTAFNANKNDATIAMSKAVLSTRNFKVIASDRNGFQ